MTTLEVTLTAIAAVDVDATARPFRVWCKGLVGGGPGPVFAVPFPLTPNTYNPTDTMVLSTTLAAAGVKPTRRPNPNMVAPPLSELGSFGTLSDLPEFEALPAGFTVTSITATDS